MTAARHTKAQADEIMRCGKDPLYFINKYVFIQHPMKGTLKFNTYPFQDECVEAFVKHRFNIVLKSRQLGLSTLAAAYSLWLAIFRRDKNILVIATKLKTAQNFIKKVKSAIAKLPPWLMIPEITYNNKQQLEFSNGSQIQAIPTSPDAGRSEALSLVIIDEAAFIRDFDTIWTAIYSTLSTGGRAIVLSTPNGVGDKYHELYTQAEQGFNEFNPIKLPWTVHPERDQAWYDKETRNMSIKQIAQELMCDFTTSGNTYVTAETLIDVMHHVQEPIEKTGPGNGLWIWKYPTTGTDYVVSADVSRGDSADYSTCQIIDTVNSEVVAEYKGKVRPDQFAEFLYDISTRYNTALLCPEINTFGYAVVMKLHDKGYKNLYYQNPKDKYDAMYGKDPNLHKIGFNTQGGSRAQILTKLEEVIRKKQIIIHSSRLVDELKTFVYDGPRAQAMKGKHDDLIMALAIGVWLYDASERKNANTSVFNAMALAFGVNKSRGNQSVPNDNDNSIKLLSSPSSAVAKNPNFIGTANAYNKSQASNGLANQFNWLSRR